MRQGSEKSQLVGHLSGQLGLSPAGGQLRDHRPQRCGDLSTDSHSPGGLKPLATVSHPAQQAEQVSKASEKTLRLRSRKMRVLEVKASQGQETTSCICRWTKKEEGDTQQGTSNPCNQHHQSPFCPYSFMTPACSEFLLR